MEKKGFYIISSSILKVGERFTLKFKVLTLHILLTENPEMVNLAG